MSGHRSLRNVRICCDKGQKLLVWIQLCVTAHRKLAVYDEWSNMSIHIAMDNTVIVNDISTFYFFLLCVLPEACHCPNKMQVGDQISGKLKPCVEQEHVMCRDQKASTNILNDFQKCSAYKECEKSGNWTVREKNQRESMVCGATDSTHSL